MDGVGKSINCISVVEGLGSKSAEEDTGGIEGRAVINVGIRLNNPDEFLTWVVEVEFDLVGRGTNGLIACELELLDEVFVGVLCHLAALVSVKEDIVDIEGSSNEGLLISSGDRLSARGGNKGLDGPEALTDGAEVKVDLYFVVLESNKRKSKSRIAAEPEKKRNVESGLRKSITRSANLGRSTSGRARTSDSSEGGVSDVGKSCCVTNHLEVSTLLFSRKSDLVPDVHPVTILTVNALTSNFYLNLSDKLLTDVIQPTGIHTIRTRGCHRLIDFRKSYLEVGAVSKISVTGDCACYTSTKICLSLESLLY